MILDPLHGGDIITFVINLIFSTLRTAVGTKSEEISFYICRGWLDILISSHSPKPSTYKTGVVSQISAKDMLVFLHNTSEFLLNHLNIGSYTGVVGAYPNNVIRAKLGKEMCIIISEAKTSSDELSLLQIFKDPSLQNTEKLQTALNNIILWLLLNYSSEQSKTPILKNTQTICKKLKSIFKSLSTISPAPEQLCKALLRTMLSTNRKLDHHLQELLQTNSISTDLAYTLSLRTSKLLNFLIKKLMNTESLAAYFALNLKGFQLLFQRLGIADRDNAQIEHQEQIVNQKQRQRAADDIEDGDGFVKESVESGVGGGKGLIKIGSDLIEGIASQMSAFEEESLEEELETEKKVGKFNPANLTVQEFASDMKLLQCTDMTNLASWVNSQWAQYKDGQNCYKLFNKNLEGESQYEFSMLFELKKMIEIKEIHIGFVGFYNDNQNDHIAPSSVIFDAGLKRDNLKYICALDTLTDGSMNGKGLCIFGRNFACFDKTLTNDGDLVLKKIASAKNVKTKFIRFTIRAGDIKTALAHSIGAREYQKKQVSISYISINGIDIGEVGKVSEFIKENNQKVAYNILNRFKLKKFGNSLIHFSQNEQIIQQIKNSFYFLTGLLTPEQRTIEPIIIALCTHNPELGNWILKELIKSKNEKACL